MRRDFWTVPAPSLGGEGRVIAYGHWGVPCCSSPPRAAARRPRGARDDRRVAGLDRGRPGQGVRRRLPRRAVPGRTTRSRWRSAPAGRRATTRGSPTRSPRRSTGDCGGRVGHRHRGRQPRGLPRRQPRPAPRRPRSPTRWGCRGNYDPTTWNGWGEQGDAVYFNNPIGLRRKHARRPPRLAAPHASSSCSSSAAARTRSTRPGRCRRRAAWPGCCGAKGIHHGLDIWGEDTPHDWPCWAPDGPLHLATG